MHQFRMPHCLDYVDRKDSHPQQVTFDLSQISLVGDLTHYPSSR